MIEVLRNVPQWKLVVFSMRRVFGVFELAVDPSSRLLLEAVHLVDVVG